MSSGTTASGAPPMFIPPPPPGMNYIAVIQPSLNMVILGGAWCSALIPLLIALFLFSTPPLRRTPTFILNVFSVLIGIVEGIINYYVEVHTILSPTKPLDTRYSIVFATIMCLIPVLVETILVIRVLAVYPPRQLPPKTLAMIYIPIIVLKVGRLSDMLVFFITFFPTVANGTLNAITLGQESWNSPTAKVAWTLQMIDNGYSSALFLLKLRHGMSSDGRVESRVTSGSYMSRIRSLFWISVSNFVFPVILSFVQLIFSFKDSDYLHGTYIVLCNAYINIIGVLFATVWSAGSRPNLPTLTNQTYPSKLSTLPPAAFAPNRAIHSKGSRGFTSTATFGQEDNAYETTSSDLERDIRVDTFTETHSEETKHEKSRV